MYRPSSFISFNCVYMSISVAYPAQRFIKASSFFLSSPFSLSLSLSPFPAHFVPGFFLSPFAYVIFPCALSLHAAMIHMCSLTLIPPF